MTENTNPKVRNAIGIFDAIREKHTSETEITGSPHTDMVESHIQGVVRKGARYLLTHSHVHGAAAQLLDVDGTKNATVVPLPVPRVNGADLNHAGGCQLLGDYLVIPFESVGQKVSRVAFYDVSIPGKPVELAKPAPIIRTDRRAGAAGITNVTVGGTEFWYLAIFDRGRLDLLRSEGGAFPKTDFRWQFASTLTGDYQAFCLFADLANNLFAVGFRLDAQGDRADLYPIDPDTQSVKRVRSKHCITNGLRNIHFRWGAGLDIRSASELAFLATGRNFLPFGLAERPAGGAADGQTNVSEAAFLKPRCHLNTFTAQRETCVLQRLGRRLDAIMAALAAHTRETFLLDRMLNGNSLIRRFRKCAETS